MKPKPNRTTNLLKHFEIDLGKKKKHNFEIFKDLFSFYFVC